MIEEMTKYYLWLLQLMGAANPRTIQLIKHFGDPRAVYGAVTGGNGGFLKPYEKSALKRASLEKAEEVIAFCKDAGYDIITLSDSNYPVFLKNIYNPPLLLFAEGSLSGLNGEISLTVVGTRNACDYSYMVTEKLCRPLAKTGTVIVSGMAVGVDKIAHSAALGEGGRTIGVLACGIDVDYPAGSMEFRKQIVACGGALITELLPGSRVDKAYFRNRNRIMSGLSQGTLIIEAAQNSGCHITAKHAISQNRDLFCVPPHNIFDPRFEGVVGYLREGAVPVFGYADIINEYRASYGNKYNTLSRALKDDAFDGINGFGESDKGNAKAEKHKKSRANTEVEAELVDTPDEEADSSPDVSDNTQLILAIMPEKPPVPDLDLLDNRQRTIADLLADGAKTVDYLLSESGMEPDDISDILLDLEIDGVVESMPGACYKLCI